MRVRFIFVVLGLCFFVVSRCASVAYLEIKNSLDRDITVKLTGASRGQEKYRNTLDVKKGETATTAIEIPVPIQMVLSSKGMNINIIIQNEDYYPSTMSSEENQTTRIEVISYFEECPDTRLVGNWKIVKEYEHEKGYEFTFFLENNKTKIVHHGFNPLKYEYMEWKIEKNEIAFRPWHDIGIKDSSNKYQWLSKSFEYIDSGTIKIWAATYIKQ